VLPPSGHGALWGQLIRPGKCGIKQIAPSSVVAIASDPAYHRESRLNRLAGASAPPCRHPQQCTVSRRGTTIGPEKQEAGIGMAKTRISSSDLVWIFTEKLRSFDECAAGTNIAIVPSEDGWTAVMGARRRGRRPRCERRIEQIQKQLREIYVLARD
jgi:hypothetical protein